MPGPRTIGIALALAVLSVVAVIDVRTTNTLVTTLRWVEHTHRVTEAIDDIGTSIGTARRARRSFLVTAEADNLAEYATAVAAVRARLAELRGLVADNAAETARLGRLDAAVAARVAVMDADIATRKAGVSLLTAPVAMQRNSDAGARVDAILGEMSQDERRLLREREAATDARVAATRALVPLGTAVGFAILGGAFLGMRRENARRRASEAELGRAKDAAETANRELESFSYAVAHDLRAPLRGMNGFAQVLLDDYGDKLDDDGVDCLREIHTNAQRMGALIDALFSLSRMSRTELRRERVDLAALGRSVLAELAAAEAGRHVELVVADSLHADVDPTLARALLQNLLSNAWKFTGKVRAPRIELGARDAAFFVRDNGAGFDMAYASKLFGVFQRLHTMSEFEGTGVGLATVQRIVQRHGGRIWAESKVDEGATFFFTLTESQSPA